MGSMTNEVEYLGRQWNELSESWFDVYRVTSKGLVQIVHASPRLRDEGVDVAALVGAKNLKEPKK